MAEGKGLISGATGVATTTVTEAAKATAAVTNTFAGALDNFIERGLKEQVSVGFTLGGRSCRATVILEILHSEEPKGITG